MARRFAKVLRKLQKKLIRAPHDKFTFFWPEGRMSVHMFPNDVIGIIADYSAMPHLLEWMPRDKLDMDMVLHQKLSFDAGLHGPEYIGLPEPEYIVEVSLSFLYVTRRIGNIYHPLSWIHTWADPDILDHLLDNPALSEHGSDLPVAGRYISWEGLCMNPHPRAIDLVLENQSADSASMNRLSRNPAMVPFFLEHPDLVDHEALWANPHEKVIELLSQMPECLYNWHTLSQNPHPWAINKLRENPDKIEWNCMSSNPGIFEYRRTPELINCLRDLHW
jgi:hypothetical protein